MMLFGDAKKMTEEIVKGLPEGDGSGQTGERCHAPLFRDLLFVVSILATGAAATGGSYHLEAHGTRLLKHQPAAPQSWRWRSERQSGALRAIRARVHRGTLGAAEHGADDLDRDVDHLGARRDRTDVAARRARPGVISRVRALGLTVNGGSDR